MLVKRYGPKQIFRPRRHVAAMLHAEAKDWVTRKFTAGTYRGSDRVNPIIHHLFEFYDNRLRSLAPQIASRDLVDFLLHQYDEANEILHGNGILDLKEQSEWGHIEPLLRRAIKYIVELLCIQQRVGLPQIEKGNFLVCTEIALECAEVAADLAEMSNRVHFLFPEYCSVVVHADSNPQAITVRITGKHEGYDERFFERIVCDRNNRDRFVGPKPQFDIHTDTHTTFLDSAFSTLFGMSYSEFIAGLIAVIDGARPAGKGHFPTLFIRRRDLVEQLSESGRPLEAIEAMLRGFTVTPDDLINENRVLWNAKQQSRAYRRGFFSFPHETGEHLAFSKAMAQEALIHLVSSVSFQRLPREWLLPAIGPALAELSNAAGNWFEEIVAKNLQKIGYHGGRVIGTLRTSSGTLEIPTEIGDLDFLGYNSVRREILLVGAKMTFTGLEAQFWRDDVDQFVRGKKSYADQFRRKRDWVSDNFECICRLMGAPTASAFDSRLLTLYPSIASEFIEDFQCESITEFMILAERALLQMPSTSPL